MPVSAIPEDQILLWLVGEGDLDTGSADSSRKADPCGRKLIFLELWGSFFLSVKGWESDVKGLRIQPFKHCEAAKESSQSYTTFPKCCPFLILLLK